MPADWRLEVKTYPNCGSRKVSSACMALPCLLLCDRIPIVIVKFTEALGVHSLKTRDSFLCALFTSLPCNTQAYTLLCYASLTWIAVLPCLYIATKPRDLLCVQCTTDILVHLRSCFMSLSYVLPAAQRCMLVQMYHAPNGRSYNSAQKVSLQILSLYSECDPTQPAEASYILHLAVRCDAQLADKCTASQMQKQTCSIDCHTGWPGCILLGE